jgi:hypothetical protein
MTDNKEPWEHSSEEELSPAFSLPGTCPFPVVFPVHFLKLYHTHSEAVRLLVMTARQGATDANIADALRKGLPHLVDPDYLQGVSASQQFEEKTGDKQDAQHLEQVQVAQKQLS